MHLRLIFNFLLIFTYLSCRDDIHIIYERRNDMIIAKTFDKGLPHSIISYRLDSITKEGTSFFYQNGNLTKIENWNDGTRVGSQSEYSNGVPTKYICFDSYGNLIFIRQFGNNAILKDSGNLLPHGLMDFTIKEIYQPFNYTCFAVQPPSVSLNIESFIVNKSNNDTIMPYRIDSMYQWVYKYNFLIRESGNYKHIRIARIIDSLLSEEKLITCMDTTEFVLEPTKIGLRYPQDTLPR